MFSLRILAAPTPQDQPQTVDFSLAGARARLDSWVDGGTRLLPNMGVALVLLAIFTARPSSRAISFSGISLGANDGIWATC